MTRKRKDAAVANAPEPAPVQNGLADAIGMNTPFGSGFPQNQGSPWTEQASNVTTAFKNLRWYFVSNFRQFLSEAYCELGLIQTIVDVPVDDALRGGIELKSEQLAEEQIAELLVSLDRDNDLVVAAQAMKWNRLFGGAGILILTDQDPELPLEMTAITEDSALEFRAVDMWELFWDKQNTEGYDPTIQSHNFEYYSYYGEKVHKSRVMRLKGLEAPSFVRPRLRGWGFSVVEALIRSINQYLKATDLSFEVLDEFKLDVYKIKNLVNTLLSPNGNQKIAERVQLGNWQKNYQHALVMDSEDDFDHKQLSFSGLAETMAQIRMQVASDMRMPLTKLFGISASGFNSGEDDLEVYNAMIESQVRNKIKYDLLRICEIKCQKLFGYVPDDLAIDFKPLRVLSAEQEETVKTQKFARLMQARTAGELSTKEFRDAVNRDNLLGITLDTSDEVLDELDGMQADMAAEGENNPEAPGKDSDDDPGADRPDTEKPTAASKGGAPKGLEKPKKANAGDWDESKHPRADDGKFGKGGGKGGKGKKPADDVEMIEVGPDGDFSTDLTEEQVALARSRFSEAARGPEGKNPATETPEETSERQHKLEKAMRERAEKPGKAGFDTKRGPASGDEYHSEGTKDEATATAKKLRADGVHATIWHIDGPKTGPKSVYAVAVPAKKAEGAKAGAKGFKSVFKGDEVEHTGKSETVDGRTFHEFVYTEGHKKGKKGLEPAPESKAADVEKSKKEWATEQEGFRKLREQGKKNPPKEKSEGLPKAGKIVDGREVIKANAVPNVDSIDSTLSNYEVSEGLREVDISLFTYTPPYSASEKARTERLAEQIKENKQIAPLIVVHDAEGYYVLEGGHRFDALNMIGAKSFPALVVTDLDNPPPEKKENATVLPKPYTFTESLARKVNSPAFDRASYAADGGDQWIDPRRAEFFKDPRDVDRALWDKARAGSKAAFGEERWQFVTWLYRKYGGKFGQAH
jgi:phage-related protein (TIGR01555 family)